MRGLSRVDSTLHSELVAACEWDCDGELCGRLYPSRDGRAAEMWDQRVSEFVWYKMTHVRKKKKKMQGIKS